VVFVARFVAGARVTGLSKNNRKTSIIVEFGCAQVIVI
jgi:hypothetical protein